MDSCCRTGSLTGSEDTAWAWGKGEQNSWGQQDEEQGWDQNVSLGCVLLDNEPHNQVAEQHEQDGVDDKTLTELVAILAGKEHKSRIQESKENGWDENLLACNISHLHFTVRKYKNLHKTNRYQGSCGDFVYIMVPQVDTVDAGDQ